jgi:hypothetical protein
LSQRGDDSAELFVLSHHDLDDAVDLGDHGVITYIEGPPDFMERSGGKLMAEVNRHVPRQSDVGGAAIVGNVSEAQVVGIGDATLDEADADSLLGAFWITHKLFRLEG